jgi:hypothetical protein
MGLAPFPISMTYDEYLKQPESANILPLVTDPVWGRGGEEGGKEVKDDGYLLPFSQFHQLKYNFKPSIIGPLLVNGDFETGDLTGWTETNPGWIVGTTRYEGSYGLDTTSGDGSCSMYQWMGLSTYSGIDFDLLDIHPQGYNFNLNFWVKQDNIYAGSNLLTIQFYNAPVHEINSTALTVRFTSAIQDGLWYNEWLKCKAPIGTRYIKLTITSNQNTYYNRRKKWDKFRAQLVHSPELNMVGVPEPVKLVDIMPQTSKNVYLKTDFPVGTVDKDYETRLKCWWGAQEA